MAAPDLQIQLQAELDSEFHIVRLLGEGSVAQVYLARERALQRLVAIKLMKSELAEDETARKRFERESRSAAKIHHHTVATVHRVGSLEDETPFIIMEYIEGRDLADVLQAEGVMTIDQACHTLSQVASALAAAHENGIVHRDVKPDNVVQERDSDRVVLTDFGIAGLLETGTETITRLTQQGQLLGDPRYMSPEQLLGESVTDESDVYSLGIMGYELLTLKTPYEGTTSVQLVTAHLKKQPANVRETRSTQRITATSVQEALSRGTPDHRRAFKLLDRVVLTDFGIAGLLETGTETITRLTQQGQLLGDPRYMSPEQLLGESVTDESDVYSLGIMGYELLTLKTPYEGTTSVQLVTAHLKKQPIPLAGLRPDVDPRLAELLERCLSKNPRHRPRASEVAKALEQVTEETHATGLLVESDSHGPQTFSGQTSSHGAQPNTALEAFIGELRRRHVFNVAVFYVLVTGTLLGIASDTLDELPLPEDTMAILVAIVLAGFPVTLVLSWMFDINSRGIQRTESDVAGSARTKLRVLQIVGLILSFGLAALVGYWVLG